MTNNDYVSNRPQRSVDSHSVKTKVEKIKETKRVIKQVEKLEIDIAQLRRQLSSKELKLSELLKTLNI